MTTLGNKTRPWMYLWNETVCLSYNHWVRSELLFENIQYMFQQYYLLKDVRYVFISRLSQRHGKCNTIRRIYLKSLPLFLRLLCVVSLEENGKLCVFKCIELRLTICNTLTSGRNNTSLIELFNCPLNPTELPCCCLVVCSWVCFVCACSVACEWFCLEVERGSAWACCIWPANSHNGYPLKNLKLL